MRVLFLGEGELKGPARYLAAILTWSKIPFDHRPDQSAVPSAWQKRSYDLFILSDYRAKNFSRASVRWVTREVQEKGAGFLMIGGWASFTGLVGGYAGHPLEKLLPVRCIPKEDRVNRAAVMTGASSSRPIIVCGYHRARAKAGTTTLLHFQELVGSEKKIRLAKRQPALVCGQSGRGTTAAFLTDCAPHWAGGLVDWGTKRVTVHVPGAGAVEVGDRYLRFFGTLFKTVSRGPFT